MRRRPSIEVRGARDETGWEGLVNYWVIYKRFLKAYLELSRLPEIRRFLLFCIEKQGQNAISEQVFKTFSHCQNHAVSLIPQLSAPAPFIHPRRLFAHHSFELCLPKNFKIGAINPSHFCQSKKRVERESRLFQTGKRSKHLGIEYFDRKAEMEREDCARRN